MDDWTPLFLVAGFFITLPIIFIAVGCFLEFIDPLFNRKKPQEPKLEWKYVEENGFRRAYCRELDLEGKPISNWERVYIAGNFGSPPRSWINRG